MIHINNLINQASKCLVVIIIATLPLKAAAEETQLELPPGIATCADEAVITAYKYGVTEKVFLPQYNQDSDVVARWIITGNKSIANLPKIAADTPFTLPCYYFTAAKLGVLSETPRIKLIEERNVPLASFKKGLSNYFSLWVDNDYTNSSKKTTERNTVINLYYAIAEAGKIVIEDDRQFRNSSAREKKQFLWIIVNALKSKGGDNGQLIAQWSAILLIDHYNKTKQETDLYAVENYLEGPLISLGKEKYITNGAGINILALRNENTLSTYGL